jgi:predicted Zn-dependent protease
MQTSSGDHSVLASPISNGKTPGESARYCPSFAVHAPSPRHAGFFPATGGRYNPNGMSRSGEASISMMRMHRKAVVMRTLTLGARFIALSVLAGGLVLGGGATDRQVISQANQVHEGLEPAVINDPELTNYLQTVGDRIITAARKAQAEGMAPKSHSSEDSDWMFGEGMKFHFVNSDTLNAFTTGGEHMYIYTKLFETCKDEDELAAVMAHEYAHVYCRHVQSGMNRQYAILGTAAAIGVATGVAAGSDHGVEYGTAAAGAAVAAGQFVGMGYTRKDESQADEYGFDFYVRAGWDPKQFGAFFQQMIDMGYDTTSEITSDHPSLASRVEIANQRAASLPPDAKQWRRPPVADEAKFKKLQQLTAKLAKTMPNDKSLEEAQTLLAAFGNCLMPTETPEQVKARKEIEQVQQKQQKKQS